METLDLMPLIEQLDDNVDDIEEALAPLLKTALSDTAGKLPLLDKAHLYVLVTYSIESILFSYLRLNGVNAKEHPVFRELTRVKQYFDKIKAAESAGIVPGSKLDKAAAGRFIKHALAGNERSRAKTTQQQATKKAAAHTHFEESPQRLRVDEEEGNGYRAGSLGDASDSDTPAIVSAEPSSDKETGEPSLEDMASALKSEGVRKRSRSDGSEAVLETGALEGESKQERKKRKKLRKKQKSLEAQSEG